MLMMSGRTWDWRWGRGVFGAAGSRGVLLGGVLLGGVLLGAVLVGAGGAGAWAQPGGTPVRVGGVRAETVVRTHAITGEIQPRRRAVVAGEEAGLVLTAPFDAGERVAAGDVLARLDSDMIELQLREQEAQLARAKAELDEQQAWTRKARRDLELVRDLASRGAAQPREVEDAQTAYEAAQAVEAQEVQSVALVEARIALLGRRLAAMSIRAPFDGVVVVKHAEMGQWIGVGSPVVEIIEWGRVDAVLDVPERLVNLIEVGMRVEVQAAAVEEVVSGPVRAVVPQAHARARTYPVRVDLLDPHGRFKSGMSVKGWVPSREFDQALTVPRDAILLGPTGSFVYAVADDAVQRIAVDVQSGAGPGRFVVTGALREGMAVVVEGNERLYPGAKVRIVGEILESTGTEGGDGR